MPTVLDRNEQLDQVSDYALKVYGNHPRCSQSQGVTKHGLVVASRIEWKNWQPGSEYIKHVLIKNTQLKMQKITYEIPESRFFTTLYPKPIILNAGTSYSLPITFHPLEKNVYRDVLKCHTNNEDFDVVLLASLPLVQVVFPESLVMPRCTVYGSIEESFQVKNIGETAVAIKWLFAEPFEIKPKECMMNVGTTCSFHVIFRPKFAKLYEGLMICQFGSEEIKYKKLRIIAQGKYPHLLASVSGEQPEECFDGLKTSVHFEDVAVGFTKQEVIKLKNLSLVEVPFKVEHPMQSTFTRLDVAFDVPVKTGLIPPLSSVELPILFTPGIVDFVYVDYFHVLPVGGMTRNIIKCVGNSVGPKICMEPNYVNFKIVNLGKEATGSIQLVNQTNIPANYQFLIDNENSCFRLSSVCGIVKPYSCLKVMVKFSPAFAMNYYRRVTCLIHNQDPLFLDLLGTCHSELVNPAVLRMSHVKRHEIRCNQGFSTLPPDQLNELLGTKAMKLNPDGRVLVPETPVGDYENPSNSMAAYFSSNPSTEECSGHVSDPPVTLDITRADFGRCNSLRTTAEKMLCVTNNTRGKVCVQWIPGSQKIFTVHPSFMEISSLKSGVFKVFFNPEMQNQLYGAELECYIYYKCMLDYRLIPDEIVCPPWCFLLACTGHTFSPEKEAFIAKHTILDTEDLCLPSTALHKVSYKTFMICNTGKTPLFYNIENDLSGIFSIKPNRGLIQSGHQICVVRFSPKNHQLYDQVLNVTFNDRSKNSKPLRFVGPCEEPEIMLENGGKIYFKQTCIGTSSESQYSFKNLTRKTLNFEWKLRNADAKEIAISPSSGQILPNDSLNHHCLFTPIHPGKRIFKWKLFIWPEDSPQNSSQFQVQATGIATTGEIIVEPNYYNFGDIVVGRLAQYNIVLCNTGSCNLVCRLLVQQTANGEELPFSENTAIHLSGWEIDMPAKSKHVVQATVRPSFQASYRFVISYQLVLDQDHVKNPNLLEPKHLCHLLMNGVFPSFIITDIHGQGSAKEISKRQLWTLFSLDNLNSYFTSDPSYQELMYSMETQKTTDRLPAFSTQAIVEFNFSAAPLHSPPSVFVLQIENNGTVPAEWALLFPDDMKLEVEPWADTGDLNDEELHQMKVLENKLFIIEPIHGYLEPGEGMAITLTYNHVLAGTDHLNVLFKVVNGREILLNFVGVTVEPERPYVHFHSNKHTFLPMPVGQICHPKQIYELYNGGAKTIQYKVDLRPLIQLEKKNYNHTIFECMNPCGTLFPGKATSLEWKFSPLECMTYTVDVPIHIEGGETALITFIGIGYDAEAMGQTMPLLDTSQNMNIPDSQSVALPGQIVGLSKERISLGNIPLFAMKHALLFVNNWSTDRQVTFNWQFASPADVQLLSVNPVKGLLQPKESKLCQLSFMDCGLPGFYDIDLICEITDETEVAKYEEELRLWENERNRQQVEFTLTEKNPDVVTPEMNDIELVVSPGRMFPFTFLSEESSPVEEQVVSYRTLPPIKQIPMDKQIDIQRHTKKSQKKKYWKKPQPPATSILHLGITARTYDVEEFEVGQPEEYRHFFFDKISGKNSKLRSGGERLRPIKQKLPSNVVCSKLHREILCGVMSNIIRGLLVDTYFHDALKDLQYEKVPYYQQLVQEVPVPFGKKMFIEELEKKSNPLSNVLSSQNLISQSQSLPSSPMYFKSFSAPVMNKVDVLDNFSFSLATDAAKDKGNMVGNLEEKEKLKHLDEFGSFVDGFLESCLLGIMHEAIEREFNLTAPSRFIALPKKNATLSPVSGAGSRTH